ncbi:MAG: MATE family efflux transporter [Lachnospiraceae bacterium]|nr:MATE family efflux transporter [Lachnospiraceae bacterium]
MEETIQQENKMGIMPIPKLLMGMSLPMMLSMMIQALYNVVDSVFVAQINENALTAVSLVFPVQNLMIAIAVGLCVGVNALLSRNLGEKDFDGANAAARNGIFLSLLCYVMFAIVSASLSDLFLRVQTSDVQIREYGTTYMRIISVCCIGVYMQLMMERLLQSTGRTFLTMITQSVGAIINLIMDPILIFGLLGFPKMGVAGAALATIFGQLVAMGLAVFMNIKWNPDVNISMKRFRPDKKILGKILAVGIPTTVVQAIGSVMTFGFNKILLMFTPTATAVFGVYFKLNSFIFMPVFGLNNGMVPIIAYNYGARKKKRIVDTIRLSVIAAVCLMVIGLIVFMTIPGLLLSMFNASEDMLAIGIPALRIICPSFLFAGYCIVIGSVFQALGNGIYSLWVSLARQLFVLLPSAYILAVTFGLDYVWWSYPIAEVASVALTTILFRKIYRQKISQL